MCGRMTLTTKGYDQLAHLLSVEEDPEDAAHYRPRYNVAPTDEHWIVRVAGKKKLSRAKWGIRPGGRELLINLRSETAGRRFKKAFDARRCLVPADGFYEWEGPKSARRPIWFHARAGSLLLFAGLYEEERGSPLPSFTVLTTAANGLVAKVHDRMPVVLSPEDARQWLEAPASDVLRPAPESVLVGTRVSSRANAVANDDPSCLGPPEEEPRAEQRELF